MASPQQFDDLRQHMLDEVNRAIDVLTLGGNEGISRPDRRPEPPRYQRIVLAYDGSEGARLALAHAKDLARAHGSRVLVASAYATPALTTPAAMGFGWYPDLMGEYARAQEIVKETARGAAADLERAGVEAEPLVLKGNAARQIAAAAASNEADLVVTGAASLGALARLALGSTATGLLDRAPCSVLLAREPPAPRRVLVATDGSRASFHAIAHALHFAGRSGAELVVQHVLAYPETADDGASREFLRKVLADVTLPRPPPRVRYALDAGDPAKRILERAGSDDCGLVVVGAHGKGQVERFFAGSVSRRVASEARASVLVVKEPHER